MTEHFSENEHRTISFRRLARKIFIDDWPMKLIAAVITLALYFGVAGETGSGTLYNVPLNLLIADNAELTNTPTQQVDIILKGDKTKIDELIRKNDLVAYCDLRNVPTSDGAIDLTPETIRIDLPAGVRLSEIRPRQIAIKLEAVIEKDVPVKAEKEGHVPEGSQVYTETVVPAKVRVRGPASYIKTLEFVSTEKISLDNKTTDFSARQVAVTVSNPKARVLDAVVDVVFRIGEKRGERLISAALKGDATGKKIPITVMGALSVLKGIKPGDLKVEMVEDDSGKKIPQLVDLPADLQGKIEIKQEERIAPAGN